MNASMRAVRRPGTGAADRAHRPSPSVSSGRCPTDAEWGAHGPAGLRTHPRVRSSLDVDRLVVRGRDDLEHFEVVRMRELAMSHHRPLMRARPGFEGHDTDALVLEADPSLQHVDHVELDFVV